MEVNIRGLTIAYGDFIAVSDLDLTVRQGEMLVLLGPSGCGKTTTMRSIAGLEQARAGRITIGDRTIVDVDRGINIPANKRNIGMVFQSYAIWPHMTVAENVGFPLRVQRVSRREIGARVEQTLALVGLEGYGNRGASKLSGGQMQRVALARSLIMRPAVLFLDEPLSNLDAKLRDRLRFELRAIQLETGVTSIFVTHDQREALALADRIAVMRNGKIVQLDEPRNMYLAPNSSFVADFLGAVNVFDGVVAALGDDGSVRVQLSGGEVVGGKPRAGFSPSLGDPATIAMRPEIIHMHASGSAESAGGLPAQVQVASFLGSQIAYRLRLRSGLVVEATCADVASTYRQGDQVTLVPNPNLVSVLPARES